MTAKEKIREEYEHMVEKLRQQRDELKVQVHLAGMEAQDEWEKLEDQWHRLQNRGRAAGQAVAQSAEHSEKALLELAHDIKEGYKRIGKLF